MSDLWSRAVFALRVAFGGGPECEMRIECDRLRRLAGAEPARIWIFDFDEVTE